jgi:hypothetical protein
LFQAVIKPAEEMLKAVQVEYDIKLRIGGAKDQICREAAGDQPGETACSVRGVRLHLRAYERLLKVVYLIMALRN